MKKKYISIVPLLCMTVSLFGATIRVYNKLGSNDKIIVTAITSQKRMVEQIESMKSVMFNTWLNSVTGFEWEIKGYKWAAPLEMRALQTEGRLYIQQNGKYTFKPCLPCRESSGQATLISSPSKVNPHFH